VSYPSRSNASLSQALKRLVDLAGALIGMLLLAPVMLGIVLLIRLDSFDPVLFRQLRRGRHGRVFQMLKFRTMVADAEQRLGDLEKHNESEHGVLLKLRDDPRVTPLGRFLRRSSLDELPQLVNILRGEMSLVGPCPLQLRDSDKLRELDPRGFACRLQVLSATVIAVLSRWTSLGEWPSWQPRYAKIVPRGSRSATVCTPTSWSLQSIRRVTLEFLTR
jgi:lipopolysaccharide/colanic/teichoic acid biosynthesis glycosyltransferase